MTAPLEIPVDVRALILSRIESLGFLEVLLLLHGDSSRSWKAGEVVQALKHDEVEVSRALVAFRQAGILKATIGDDVSYSYSPAPGPSEMIDALAGLYRDRPQAVLDLIATRPRQKLRLFAEAFRLRRN